MNDNFLIKRGHFTPLAILLMILLPLVTALICICLGRMNVPVGDVIAVFRDVLTGNEGHAQNYSIVINLRLPRILMSIIVGAGLTCAGKHVPIAVFQSTGNTGHSRCYQRHLRGSDPCDHPFLHYSGDTAHCTCVRTCLHIFYIKDRRKK